MVGAGPARAPLKGWGKTCPIIYKHWVFFLSFQMASLHSFLSITILYQTLSHGFIRNIMDKYFCIILLSSWKFIVTFNDFNLFVLNLFSKKSKGPHINPCGIPPKLYSSTVSTAESRRGKETERDRELQGQSSGERMWASGYPQSSQ